jgi:hypothetical protein
MFDYQTPQQIYADDVKASETQTQVTRQGASCWTAARPVSLSSLRTRFSLAWKVFTGQADALLWRGDQGKNLK